MSPLLEPPAARPHATDLAPCLNRCSINNACSSATHLPGGQIGKRGVDERGRKKDRRNESMFGWKTRGKENGQEPRSWSDYWEMDRSRQWTSEPGYEVFSFSHLLQRRLWEIQFNVNMILLGKDILYCDLALLRTMVIRNIAKNGKTG